MGVLLAINQDGTIQKIPVEKTALAELDAKFAHLANQYVAERETVPYEPGYAPTPDELMKAEYELPAELSGITIAVPTTLPVLDPATLASNPPVALVHVKLGKSPTFCFQVVSKSNLLSPRRALLFGDDYFEFNETVGLLPTSRLDAFYEGGQLFFRNELQVRRFLDLEVFFTEASDTVIEAFFDSERFDVGDLEKVKTAATKLLRRKIARLSAEGATFSTKQVKSAAKDAGVEIEFSGTRIVLPSDRRGLKEVVDLLSHSYVRSMVDPTQRFYASSKRPISN